MTPSKSVGTVIDCAGRALDLTYARVMGVLNVTPDSFSDGGELYRDGAVLVDTVCRRAERMVQAGAAVLDIGGESTRPGADPVSESEELDRVLPVVEAVAARFDVVISLDTSTPSVMREAAALGAGMINDVRALTRPGALAAAAQTGLPVCFMHMQGEPDTMQVAPGYGDVVGEVAGFLSARVADGEAAGISRSRMILDPGFGFGKRHEDNLRLLANLEALAALGLPVLVGLSRKSMIGRIIDRSTDQRLPASLSLAVMAVERGARLVRAHDVQETFDALAMWNAVEARPYE